MSDSNNMDSVLAQRRAKRMVRKGLTMTLGSLGKILPVSVSRALARKSGRWGYLLSRRGDIVIDDYLGEFKVWIDANSIIERQLLTQSYESEIIGLISKVVRPDDHCFDVGSNVGAIALALGRAVGANGKVHCFEPGPRFIHRLQENVRLNPTLVGRFEFHAVGLSDKQGELLWREDPEFPGNAWCLADHGTTIPVVTLDQVVAEKKMDRVDLIKIDTEGMELEVLKGARKTLERFEPDLILETEMEFEAIRGFPVRKQVEQFLVDLGYEIYSVHSSGALKKATYPNFTANAFVTKRPQPNLN